jgi:hypothetical protein
VDYRYIGAISYIGDNRLNDYGTQVKIADLEMLTDVVAGGVALVPETSWGKLGFTEDELNANPDVTKFDMETDPGLLKKHFSALSLKFEFSKLAHAYRDAAVALDSVSRFYTSFSDQRQKRAQYEAIIREHDPQSPLLGRYVHWHEMVAGPDGSKLHKNTPNEFKPSGSNGDAPTRVLLCMALLVNRSSSLRS